MEELVVENTDVVPCWVKLGYDVVVVGAVNDDTLVVVNGGSVKAVPPVENPNACVDDVWNEGNPVDVLDDWENDGS